MILDMTFTEQAYLFDTTFTEQDNSFNTEFSNFQIVSITEDIEPYEGDYEVTPRVSSQQLLTNGKLMLDDVEVKSIPYHEVSNTSNGTTISIACEFHEPINPEDVVLVIPKTITKNGTYNALDDGANAYNPIIVDVKPEGIEGSLEIAYSDGTIEMHEFIEINTKEK